jgi:hypothetical protein
MQAGKWKTTMTTTSPAIYKLINKPKAAQERPSAKLDKIGVGGESESAMMLWQHEFYFVRVGT